MDNNTAFAIIPQHNLPAASTIATLATIPEEEIWLARQKSPQTRRAYRLDVQHLMQTLRIRSVDHKAVIAWERIMREGQEVQASTVRRRLAALSSLFKHLVQHGYAERNPGYIQQVKATELTC